jgi:cycloartenol synthase
LHIEGHSTMFGTTLNYVTLRLLGEGPNASDGAIEKGRNWILKHEGATYTTSWGKFWLTVCIKYFYVHNGSLICSCSIA